MEKKELENKQEPLFKEAPLLMLLIISTMIFLTNFYFGNEIKAMLYSASDISYEEKRDQEADKDMKQPEITGVASDTTAAGTTATEEAALQQEEVITLGAVTKEYFGDALFIGDSRTVSLYEYGKLDNAVFYAVKGLTIWSVFDEEIVSSQAEDGSTKNITIEQALGEKSYSKIYLMLGINELGSGTAETFYEKYKEVVARIQSLQPHAVIFIQSIMHVTNEVDEKKSYVNNEEINVRNSRIETLADNKRIFYLNVNQVVDDAEGKLNAEYTFDGVHLKAVNVKIWEDFLYGCGAVSSDPKSEK